MVLTDALSEEDYWNNPSLFQVSTQRRPFRPTEGNLKKLIAREDIVPNEFHDLIDESNFICETKDVINDLYKDLGQVREKIRDYIIENIPNAVKSHSITTTAEIDLFLNDE